MKRKDNERPTTRVIELQHRTMILVGSPTGTSGAPSYTPFDKEEEW